MTTGKTECQHHWIIPSAQGGVPSEGTCKRCGGSRLFRHEFGGTEGQAGGRRVFGARREQGATRHRRATATCGGTDGAFVNYYNDNDPYAAAWLRNLVAAGHLPPGDVDDRSILEVSADDVRGYEQCHWFCGIGGWPLALEWAGWRGPVWTGSCPCQPLSSAGKQKGDADERHLWPAFQQLIAQCGPPVVFGEQVASKLGREWFAAVRTDLESVGYACGAADMSAAGVGAPHIRQRLYWVANAIDARTRTEAGRKVDGERYVGQSGAAVGLANAERDRTGRAETQFGSSIARIPRIETNGYSNEPGADGSLDWQSVEWLACADGKARPTKPGIHPLADGLPGRVGQLRAYGNAIVPQLAATFVRSFMELPCETP